MTVVTNTLTDQAGNPLVGIAVQIVLLSADGDELTQAFEGTTQISPNADTATNTDGYWELDLYPNDSILPAGTYYKATHVIPGDDIDQVVDFVVPVEGATVTDQPLSTLVV